jgi:general nucleoside transport system permease protein
MNTAATTVDVEMAARRPADPSPRSAMVRRVVPTALLYLVSVGVALGLCALLVVATGGSATKVLSAMLDGAIRSPGAWGLTISTATPLLIVAVGSIVQGKAGMSNIGQEGQFLIGAGGAAFVATRMQAPGWVIISTSLAVGAVAALLWTMVPVVLKFTRKVPEVISTLLMLFIAVQLAQFALTKRWFLSSRSTDSRVNNGEALKPGARMPTLEVFGNQISWSAVIAIVLTITVALVLGRTTTGFKIRMLGLNERTARRAGVSAAIIGGGALLFSGLAAGLAGGVYLTSDVGPGRFTAGISNNLGWQGLLVALLARQRAALAIPMAFVFASLRTGSNFLAATGVDRQIADVVQAMLVLALLVPPAIQAYQLRQKGGAS